MSQIKSLMFLLICSIWCEKTETSTTGVECGFYENNWNKLTNQILSFGKPYRKYSGSYKCKFYTNYGSFENQDKVYGENIDADATDININMLMFSSNFCDKLSNVEEVILTDTKIETLNENLLKYCEDLKYFRAHANQIVELPENIFMDNKQLEILWLHENQIKSLPSKIFMSLRKLKVLQLQHNRLRELSPLLFENLVNLQYLDLSGFSYSNVPMKMVESAVARAPAHVNDLSSLYTGILLAFNDIDFNDNNISELPPGIFARLINLKELNLYNNNLSTLHSNSFGVHHTLKLVISNNKISSVEPDFIDKTELSSLDFRINSCANFYSEDKIEMKANLSDCFRNYRPRPKKDCGVPVGGHGNVIGGKFITRGSYPWIAALIRNNGEYLCGGTLVSNRKVVTAAHCIQDKFEDEKLLPNGFRVLLGVHNLKDPYELKRMSVAVQRIYVHPDWNPQIRKYDADIAVLIIEQRVKFDFYVQPICTFLTVSAGVGVEKGVVVGYGKSEDERKEHEEIPKIIDIPIHRNDDCFLKFEDLLQLSSDRTFCGGSANGTGVCLGDSGSGLVVKQYGAYYLRGIVSSSMRTFKHGCDVYQYSVFTDVLKFNEWINGTFDGDL